jgi:2-oxoisovalerate dehydrogenase E1 component
MEAVEAHLLTSLRGLESPPGVPRTAPEAPLASAPSLTGTEALLLFDAQLASRHLDVAAHWLRSKDAGYYTIGSSGHEGNAAVAAALRPTDPALLHYRSGAFYVSRGWQVPGHDPVRDVLLGLCAAAEDPISGGRHKVFGHPDLAVLPQTSTIASHLPRAVGMAFAVERSRKLGLSSPWPDDAVVVAGAGDASINHSTFVGALNTAGWVVQSGLAMPLLVVVEDNGMGISVPSPPGWVTAALSGRPHLRYFAADGCDVTAVHEVATEAVDHVRRTRRPALLHLDLVRLTGHAGSDVETAYRSPRQVAADLERDPLLVTARHLIAAGLLTPDEVVERYETGRSSVLGLAAELAGSARLDDAATVMQPLRLPDAAAVAVEAAQTASEPDRARVFVATLPEAAGGLTLAQAINATLLDVAAARPEVVVFGEDVSRKGGVYGVTRGLRRALGAGRVFDTLLDEQAILGLALGCGVSGMIPVPELQYLAYLHNAEDQLRGEAATLPFFSDGAFRNPMVVRIAAYADPGGFGGHFHNDSGLGVLRDVPGLVIASPSRPADAAAMLRTCLAAAASAGTVSVFLEPIALYHRKDLFEPGDQEWLDRYPAPSAWAATHVPIGSIRVYGDPAPVTLVTFGSGVPMSLRVARRLAAEGIGVRVVDLRWLAPLPVAEVLRVVTTSRSVLVVDETRRTGGVSEGLVTGLVEGGYPGTVRRVTAEDSLVPLGPAAEHVVLTEAKVEAATRLLSE